MKGQSLLYHGPLWEGSTSLQRVRAFSAGAALIVIPSDDGHRVERQGRLLDRVFWRLRFPIDTHGENDSLVRLALEHRPDVVFVDNSKVIQKSTLRRIRAETGACLVYYSPDDVTLHQRLSIPLRRSLQEWDIVFTTKSFNVAELGERGVRRPILVGKAFDPGADIPMSAAQVGADYEIFDAAFVGTYEKERCASINALAEAGVSVVVHGSDKGGWRNEHLHPTVVLRPSVFAQEYRRCWHHGKIALCFLRKMSRDRITQRTMEIAAMGRPMLAERTDEHDQHFKEGVEYVGFRDDQELVAKAKELLGDSTRRQSVGASARLRCLSSGYSSHDRAVWMLDQIRRSR